MGKIINVIKILTGESFLAKSKALTLFIKIK